MNNPLSHVGQTPHPEVPKDVDAHCAQAQSQQKGGQGQTQQQGNGGEAGQADGQQPASLSSEPPATRLPQHPEQQQDNLAHRPAEPQRIRQQGETKAEDTPLPSPTDAD